MPSMELAPPLYPCRSYAFLYPANESMQPRRLLVTRVRDIHEGHEPDAQWLITGIDLDHRTEASFQFDTMRHVQPIPEMSIRVRGR
jgi:hypothetical protein